MSQQNDQRGQQGGGKSSQQSQDRQDPNKRGNQDQNGNQKDQDLRTGANGEEKHAPGLRKDAPGRDSAGQQEKTPKMGTDVEETDDVEENAFNEQDNNEQAGDETNSDTRQDSQDGQNKKSKQDTQNKGGF